MFDAAAVSSAIQKFLRENGEGSSRRTNPGVTWQDRFEAAKDFATKNGHIRVEPDTEWNGIVIGHWVRNHRALYKIPDRLSPDTIQLIETIPHWDWKPGRYDWDEAFDCFERAMKKLGTRAMFARTRFEGRFVGSWVRQQRKRYELGRLPKRETDLLNSIEGWEWSASPVGKKQKKRASK